MFLSCRVFLIVFSEFVEDLFIVKIFFKMLWVLVWVEEIVNKDLLVEVWIWWDLVLKLFVIFNIFFVCLCILLVFEIEVCVEFNVVWDFCRSCVLFNNMFCIFFFRCIDFFMVVWIWFVIVVLEWYSLLVWLRKCVVRFFVLIVFFFKFCNIYIY